MKAQGATEYLVIVGVVLMIALVCVALLVWPTGTTKDAKKQQSDIQYGIKILDENFLSGTISYFHLNEGSGTTASDSKSSATGAISGSSWTDGVSGSAVSFDGYNDKITINKVMFDQYNQTFSYSFWAKATNGGMSSQKLVCQGMGGPNNNLCFCVCYKPATTMLYLFEGDNSACNTGAPISYAKSLNEWTHVVATYDYSLSANKSKLYVNGKFVAGGGSASCVQAPSADFMLGSHTYNYGAGSSSLQVFNGTLDEVRVFNRAITPDEAYQLYLNPDKS